MINELDNLEFFQEQLSENIDDKTKGNIIDKIRKYTSRLIELELNKEAISKEEDNIQYTKDLLDIMNKINNHNF